MTFRFPRAPVVALLIVCLAPTWVMAQGVPTPKRSLIGAVQEKPGEGAKRLVGTWGIKREMKEANEIETTLIEFRQDGSYATRLRSSVFKDQETVPLASGRYSVVDDDGKAFTLVLDRAPGDPDGGKDDGPSQMRVAVVDEKTLRAEDGSVVQRIR